MGTSEGTKQGSSAVPSRRPSGRPLFRCLHLLLGLAPIGLGLPACDEPEPTVVGEVDAAAPDGPRVDGAGGSDGAGTEAGEAGPVTTSSLTILHTNDLHAHLWGHSPEADYTPATLNDDTTVGGFARLAAVIKAERGSAGADVLLLDGGDFLMGTLFQLAGTSKAPELKLMQALGYDAATIGNHEFDFTAAGLAAIVAAARAEGVTFPLLATNMKLSTTAPEDDGLAALFGADRPIRSKLVKTLPNGLKVGLFGLLGAEAARFAAAARPVTFEAIATSAAAAVAELRNSDGVDLVIALSQYTASNILFQRVTAARVIKEGQAPQAVDFNSTTRCYKVTSTHYLAALLGVVKDVTNNALSVTPKLADCQTPVGDLFTRRIDANPATAGVQELKQYQAVLQFLTTLPDSDSDTVPNLPDRYMASQQRLKRTP